jgi:hypothetical protein
MLIKEYKDTRICILDFDSVYNKSLKDVVYFCSKNNIRLNVFKGDTAKLLYHYLIDNLYNNYKSHNTTYNKVYGVSASALNNKFIKNVLSVITIPWCVITNINNPDNKFVALNALNKNAKQYSRIRNFVNKNNLDKLQKKLHRHKLFSNGTVDLPPELD